MALGEFALIDRFFARCGARRGDVALGVGDDGAVLAPPPGEDLVAVVDTLVEGAHFPVGAPPRSIGHRALAVNLSDIAAMGATPRWATLALTLPRADESWLEEFAAGFSALARAQDVALVGGDTTAGPLTVSVQVLGGVPHGAALTRAGAQPGDLVCVSGTPGDAAAGLAIEQGRPVTRDTSSTRQGIPAQELVKRFRFPTPRVALGLALRGIASACIDISDGLAGDLAKLAAASGCGARIDVEKLPLSPALIAAGGREAAERFALTGGDDYELCFTLPAARRETLEALAATGGFAVTVIGACIAGAEVTVTRGDSVIEFSHSGFDHFAR